MDKEFATNHQKYIKKLKKFESQSVILPKVKRYEFLKISTKKPKKKKNAE